MLLFLNPISELKNGLDIDKNDVDIESLNNKIKQFKKKTNRYSNDNYV